MVCMIKQTQADPANTLKLRELRHRFNLSARDISEITGIARSTVNEWLRLRFPRPMPDRSLRLLKLELGIVRPGWRRKPVK